jgi:tellurite resistance protein
MFILKKALFGAAAAAVLTTLVFGRDAVSYVKTFGCSARDAIKSEVPIEFEIQRARDMVGNLIPDIRKCMHVIAEEEVNVEHLNQDIARADVDLNKQKADVLTLQRDVNQERPVYQYASRSYSQNDVKRDLACRFERYKTAEATLASKRQILSAREKSVIAAREKLEGMLTSKRDLEVQIENLDARLKTIQAAQTATNVQLDDSQLARAKKLIGDLNKQLDVAQKMLDTEGKFAGLIQVETTPVVPEDLSAQIDDYFGRGNLASQTTNNAVAERGSR